MARIDHTNHAHPATPAARKACRAAGATLNLNVLLSDAVDAYRKMLASRRWNDRTHRANVSASMATTKAYAEAAGMTNVQASEKVSEIARNA